MRFGTALKLSGRGCRVRRERLCKAFLVGEVTDDLRPRPADLLRLSPIPHHRACGQESRQGELQLGRTFTRLREASLQLLLCDWQGFSNPFELRESSGRVRRD
jgi:hypothetical protein